MARRVKLFDNELIVKRVITKIENGSNSSYNYKKINYSTNKNENNPRGKEVVIKLVRVSKFQIMFPLVSHLCFHFFKQVLRV